MPDQKIKEYLDNMIYYNPLYTINDLIETCVEFAEHGKDGFRRIYMGRPKMEPKADERSKLYTFCSHELLFNHFKRFNPGEANILYPKKLKEGLFHFHERHLEKLK